MAVTGAPMILRIYGKAKYHPISSRSFQELTDEYFKSDMRNDLSYRSVIEIQIFSTRFVLSF